MRVLWIILLISGMSFGQEAAQSTSVPADSSASRPVTANPVPAPASDPNAITIPAGTRIPLSLTQAISTKNAREGDAVYAETAFPFVVDNRVIVPAGSYVQGKISRASR